MSVDRQQRLTAPERRAQIVQAMSHEMDRSRPSSAVARMEGLVRSGRPRHLVVSGDIDGIVSAMMLARVTDWRAIAMILGSRDVLLHPSLEETLVPSLVDSDDSADGRPRLFGVDVFSPLYDNVSNHPLRWGSKRLADVPRSRAMTEAFDEAIDRAVAQRLVVNPSQWVGIEAAVDSAAYPRSMRYRYPLGTAQLLLAVLEAADLSPRMFDREFLPWMVANCDGGLETIRSYPFNAPMWWSALGAAVGPASLTESLYQLATNQRPNQFRDVTNLLRSEEPDVARALKDNWNLADDSPGGIATVVRWLSSISGWPDPFLDGVDSLGEWSRIPPPRGTLKTSGRPSSPGDGDEQTAPDEALRSHLMRAASALYSSFTHYPEGVHLGWMLPR